MLLFAHMLAGCALFQSTSWRPSVSLKELSTRDKLEHPGDRSNHNIGQRTISHCFWAELDGTTPHELILRVDEYLGHDTWRKHFYAYNLQGPNAPTLMAPPLTHQEHMDDGFAYARDVDGDGREELIVVGDKDHDGTVHDIYVYSWSDHAFQDLMWGDHPGARYIWFDHDDDGTLELIALTPDPQSKVITTTVLALNNGFFRPIWGQRPEPWWLPRAYTAYLKQRTIHRPVATLGLLTEALKQRQLVPHDLSTMQRMLGKHLSRTSRQEERAAYILAMSWPNNEDALTLARGVREHSGRGTDFWAAAALLAMHGDPTDRATLIEPLRILMTQEKLNVDPTPLVLPVLQGFQKNRDMRAFDAAETWMQQTTLGNAQRVMLWRTWGRFPSFLGAFQRAIRAHRTPHPTSRMAADALAKAKDIEPSQEFIKVLLSHPDEHIRGRGAQVAVHKSRKKETQRMLLTYILYEQHAVSRTLMLEALATIKADVSESVHKLLLARALPRERLALHQLTALSKNPDVFTLGVLKARSSQELELYTLTPEQVSIFKSNTMAWSKLIDALTTHMRAPQDSKRRFVAVRLLGTMRALRVDALMESTLHTETDVSVRKSLIQALGAKPKHTQVFAHMLAHEQDDEVRHAARDELAKIATHQSRLALQAFVHAQFKKGHLSAKDLTAYGNAGGDLGPMFSKLLASTSKDHRALHLIVSAAFATQSRDALVWLERTQKKIKTNKKLSHQLLLQALRSTLMHVQNLKPWLHTWSKRMALHPKRCVRIIASKTVMAHDTAQVEHHAKPFYPRP